MAPADKILKPKGVKPTPMEEQVAKAIFDIAEFPSSNLKADLREFKFSAVKEVTVGSNKNDAIVVFVPYKVWRESKKIVKDLIPELEKKFSKKHVILVANRTLMDKNFKRKDPNVAVRPRNRTLTAVHESILEDVCSPCEIVGKRTRVCADGSKIIRILLDKKDKALVEEKLQAFNAVYRTLTTKEAVFELQ